MMIALVITGALFLLAVGYEVGVYQSRATVVLWRKRAEAAGRRAAEWEAEAVRIARRQPRTLAPSPRSIEELVALGWCIDCGAEPRSTRCAACIARDGSRL